MTGPTHEVTNQPPPLVGHDVFGTDRALVEAVERYAGPDAPAAASPRWARRAGSEEAQRWGVEANANPPVLRTHDRYGHRVDEVDFHPAWHELMDVAVGAGLHAAAVGGRRRRRTSAGRPASWCGRRSRPGHGCPVSMTYAAVPALRSRPGPGRGVGAGPVGHRRTTRACGRPRRRPGCWPAWA